MNTSSKTTDYADTADEFPKARPRFLPGKFEIEAPKSSIQGLAEAVKYLIFAAIWWLVVWVCLRGIVATEHRLSIVLFAFVVALPAALFSLVSFNSWQTRRELRRAAFEDWCDRVAAICRQYETTIPLEKLNFYFEHGISPERTVRSYREHFLKGTSS